MNKKFVNVNNINFKNYDIVLAYEGAVSKDIIIKNKNTKWGLILEDHSQKILKNIVLKNLIIMIFLNLTQGYSLYSLFSRKHCIDFSYTFVAQSLWKFLKLEKFDLDVLIEIQQPSTLKKSLGIENMKIEKLDGGLKVNDYLKNYQILKYFFVTYLTPRWEFNY